MRASLAPASAGDEANTGTGWILNRIGVDADTGQEELLGSNLFPVETGTTTSKSAHDAALQAGIEWLEQSWNTVYGSEEVRS